MSTIIVVKFGYILMLVFLIGFMGSGKSYTARQLQKLLDMPLKDMDDEIVSHQGISVKEIFEKHGEDYFRDLEHDYLQRLNPIESIIISAGGGTPCFYNNMEIMNAKGITIYLNRDKALNMQQLLKRKERRPLIAKMTDEEVNNFFDEMHIKRSPYYNEALLHAGNADSEIIAMMIRAFKL